MTETISSIERWLAEREPPLPSLAELEREFGAYEQTRPPQKQARPSPSPPTAIEVALRARLLEAERRLAEAERERDQARAARATLERGLAAAEERARVANARAEKVELLGQSSAAVWLLRRSLKSRAKTYSPEFQRALNRLLGE